MILVFLFGCADDMEQARARAETFLQEHPRGTAIVQASVGGDSLQGVVGTVWHGEDLAAWLATCDVAAEGAADAELVIEPGASPWKVHGDHLDPCVRERLGSFPFEEPSRRAERDVVLVRWRPAEVTEPLEVTHGPAGAEATTLAPPYWRISLGGERPWGQGPEGLPARMFLRPPRTRDFVEGVLDGVDAWARQLTCTGESDELHLVRAMLTFEVGRLDEVWTLPHTPCVEARARENRKWMALQGVGGRALREHPALIVLDVPVGAW